MLLVVDGQARVGLRSFKTGGERRADLLHCLMPRSLQLDEDMNFQERAWRFERLGWLVVAGLLLLGVLGLFGGGLLSRGEARRDGFSWQFPRFERATRLTTFEARVPVSNGEARVRLDHAFLRAVNLRSVSPPPDAVSNANGAAEYRFRTSGTVLTISFSASFERAGRVAGRVEAAPSGAALKFSTLVFP